jgi:hypothetical protein
MCEWDLSSTTLHERLARSFVSTVRWGCEEQMERIWPWTSSHVSGTKALVPMSFLILQTLHRLGFEVSSCEPISVSIRLKIALIDFDIGARVRVS